LLGDFHSKIDKKGENDRDYMGEFGKDERNTNGEQLRDFLAETSLYPANAHFKNRSMQIATWHGGKPVTNSRREIYRPSQPGIHNQIDYIAIPRKELPIITDPRAYVTHLFKHRKGFYLVFLVILPSLFCL
jgi:hypothetical protein